MQLSIPDNSFLDSFEHLGSIPLDAYGKDKLNLFMLRINANEFDYEPVSYTHLKQGISKKPLKSADFRGFLVRVGRLERPVS